MAVAWSNATVLQLIDLYRSNRLLWDSAHIDYKNKKKKNDAWEYIANSLQQTRREVECKIHTLRSQFMREKKKIEFINSRNSGSAFKTNWFAYDALTFLIKDKKTAGVTDAVDTKVQLEENDPLATFLAESDISPKTELAEQTSSSQQSSRASQKRKLGEDQSEEVYSIASVAHKEKTSEDEFDVYGQYVASELRAIKDEYSLLMAKRHINNIMIDARLGRYQSNFSQDVSGSSEKVRNDSHQGTQD